MSADSGLFPRLLAWLELNEPGNAEPASGDVLSSAVSSDADDPLSNELGDESERKDPDHERDLLLMLHMCC